ncbi:MAG: glycosyltransferase family 4 protein [Bacteroidaceae bacterium]|nr:glycosyltransferase family 4 protein [Bacteroidaceae bacterium]
MRVLIVNTSERTGGAAVAANRLTEALNNHGVKAKMLVRDKQTDHITTVPLPASWRLRWNFLWERFVIWWENGFRRKDLFAVSIANSGTDITRLPEFREADIIHLHWVNQGMLSLKGLQKILASGKPVVWTLHDMWPCTGICHYARECKGFHDECGQCWLLCFPKDKDLSHKVFLKKQQVYSKGHIHFVGCSHWIEKLAQQSLLTKGHDVCSINNTLNTSLFHPISKEECRKELGLPIDKRLILFGAAKVTDKRKGFNYFKEACYLLKEKYPKLATQIGIAVFGSNIDDLRTLFPFPIYRLGYIKGEQQMVKVYNAVDLFAIPSLEDNLPNTIAESMACGTPCVGFRIGGIPEMISHLENGYVAEYRNAEDFAHGIHWILNEADTEALGKQARQKAIIAYGEDNVAKQYIHLYEEALTKKHD